MPHRSGEQQKTPDPTGASRGEGELQHHDGRARRTTVRSFHPDTQQVVKKANPNPNQQPTAQLRPTWLAIVTGRARPDEPEVVGGVQGW